MCTHHDRYGSVSREGVQEALASSQLAITPHEPRWLLNTNQIHTLNEAQQSRTRALLSAGKLRHVDEDLYRDETQGNRDDSTALIFYLYADNGQCLGGRVVRQRVLMDDFELDEAAELELYDLFRPALTRLFPGKL